jgi:signal transduction histidine kinase
VKPRWSRSSAASWQVLLAGIVVALVVATGVMAWLMRPPFEEIATLVTTLAFTSLLSMGVGYLLYRRGWTRSPSLTLTLVLTYAWGAILTLFNVWIMARLMFASDHDLALAVVLLLFAAIIATTFGLYTAASVTDSLGQLADTAKQVAAGDLSVRAQVPGRDEIAQLATAFNDLAAQLEEAAASRQEIETMRRDLIAWASHDLRTPLTGIRVMVEALHDGFITDAPTVHRYYRTILADVLALNRIIDDLFELAQLDAGGLALDLAPHSLSDLISDALETFQPLAAQRGIELTGEVSEDLDPVVLNAPKMGRVLANLIGNALQHTPADGRVWLAACRVDDDIRLKVQDSGPGFNPADLPHVFEKFYRGEQARSRVSGGAGLGLAIAWGLVNAHGGRMWAENSPEGGAVVTLTLPARLVQS